MDKQCCPGEGHVEPSSPCIGHVGKFVIVSAAAFHDLDKALHDKNTFFSLSWLIALKESTTALISSSMLFGAYWC
jgi:hypothetical protein